MSDLLCFIPGNGLTLLGDSKLVPLGVLDQQSAKKIASELSSNSNHPSIGHLLEGQQFAIDATVLRHQPQSPEALNFSSLCTDGIRFSDLTNQNSIDWSYIENWLSELRYKISTRETFEHASINTSKPTIVVEVSTAEGSVTAEGKGLKENDVRKSALAEAIERIVATSAPTSGNLVHDSATNLRNLGYHIPVIRTGLYDLYSEDLLSDWTPVQSLCGSTGYLPTELMHYDYLPRNFIKGFGQSSTTGLASGSSLVESVFAATLELIERDAYWITMRCRANPSRLNPSDEHAPILEQIRESGLRAHILDIRLDWPIPVTMVILEDMNGRIPAFAHGLSAHLDQNTSISRALVEACQVRSGLQQFATSNFYSIVDPDTYLGTAKSAWSNPAFKGRLTTLLECREETTNKPQVTGINELLSWIQNERGRIFYAHLGSVGKIEVTRTYVENIVGRDAEVYNCPRLQQWAVREAPKGLYNDWILT